MQVIPKFISMIITGLTNNSPCNLDAGSPEYDINTYLDVEFELDSNEVEDGIRYLEYDCYEDMSLNIELDIETNNLLEVRFTENGESSLIEVATLNDLQNYEF